MNNFLVITEHNNETVQYLVSADDINYTTKSVCLTLDLKTVAYFRRDNVISISRHGKDIILSNGKELEE